jgi:hypothetical protein
LNSSQVIVTILSTSQCISCSSVQYGAATAADSITCNCLGNGLVYASDCGGSCSCPDNNIILPSFTCFACPAGATSLTSYECLCPTDSFWNYANQNCTQCGTSDVPNSLSSGGTSLSCLCSAGYIWDVMTQTCVLSTVCTTVTAGCMTCPSGAASNLTAASAHNLTGGTLVLNLLSGPFTNYNQIKGYKCSCKSGYSWDSMRLRCYTTELK